MDGAKSKDGWSCRLCGATTTRLKRHDRHGLDCCNICYCQQRRQIVKEQKERAKHAGTEAVYTCPPPAAPAASASGAPPRPACAPRASKEAAKSLFRGGLVRGLESSSCSSGEHYSPRSSALQRPSAIRFGSVDGSKSISESVSLPEPRQLSPRHAPPGVQQAPLAMAFPRQLCRKRAAAGRGRVITEELWLRMARLRSQQPFIVDHSTPRNVRRMAFLWAVHSAFRKFGGDQCADALSSEMHSSSSMDCTPVPQQLR